MVIVVPSFYSEIERGKKFFFHYVTLEVAILPLD